MHVGGGTPNLTKDPAGASGMGRAALAEEMRVENTKVK